MYTGLSYLQTVSWLPVEQEYYLSELVIGWQRLQGDQSRFLMSNSSARSGDAAMRGLR